ncbi:MAG: hypothetical protein EBV06_07325 [Planctomycetia bacterium]|nr:hypothetical protein [Planctomycetia bacterium]
MYFTTTETYACPPRVLFNLLRRPAILLALVPPEFGLTLIDGPDILDVSALYTVQARRWGLSQKIVTEVVECREPERLVEQQQRGPFRRWRLQRDFRDSANGTEFTEQIEVEPPSGLLGLTLTAARIEADIKAGIAWRRERLPALILGSSD